MAELRWSDAYVAYIRGEVKKGLSLQDILNHLHEIEISIGIVCGSFIQAGYDARTTKPARSMMWLRIFEDGRTLAQILWVKRPMRSQSLTHMQKRKL